MKLRLKLKKILRKVSEQAHHIQHRANVNFLNRIKHKSHIAEGTMTSIIVFVSKYDMTSFFLLMIGAVGPWRIPKHCGPMFMTRPNQSTNVGYVSPSSTVINMTVFRNVSSCINQHLWLLKCSGTCPVAGCGISGVEPWGSATPVFV
jgi:hypothetical protein